MREGSRARTLLGAGDLHLGLYRKFLCDFGSSGTAPIRLLLGAVLLWEIIIAGPYAHAAEYSALVLPKAMRPITLALPPAQVVEGCVWRHGSNGIDQSGVAWENTLNVMWSMAAVLLLACSSGSWANRARC